MRPRLAARLMQSGRRLSHIKRRPNAPFHRSTRRNLPVQIQSTPNYDLPFSAPERRPSETSGKIAPPPRYFESRAHVRAVSGRELLPQTREIRPWTLCAHACSAFLRALRCPPPRLLLYAGEERTQPLRRRLTRCARRLGWQRQARVDLGEAPVSFDVLAAADNAVGKRDARLSARKLAHLEAIGTSAHIVSPAIALWRDEHAIVVALDHLGEVRIELYDRVAARELRAPYLA
jgi:hypothetical protein